MACKAVFYGAAAVAGLLAASVLAPTAAQAGYFSPSPAAVTAGDTVSITLDDSFAANSGIGGIDLEVGFETNQLVFENVTNGSLLTSAGWDPPVFNTISGLISISEDLGNDPSGTGDVLTLTFGALAADPTTTTAVILLTNPSDFGIPGEYQLPLISDDIHITAATIVPVPEPAGAAVLLLPGLALLLARRRAG